jgi:peptidyl-prolyl cis-trans isomerase B (cyclophilin B)
MSIEPSANYTATIKTNCGAISLELLADKAPITVNNFVFLAKDGFYDGVVFHRVIPDFMIQGGDPTGTGSGGPGYRVQDEFDPSGTFAKSRVLAMANAGPGTNGSQFFITLAPTPHLNGAHTIFGRVVQGQDVVEAIVATRGPGDRPKEPVVIETIAIVQAG